LFYAVVVLGLPRPLGGSGCFAARCSLGPARLSAARSAAFGGPAVHPSAILALRAIGGRAANLGHIALILEDKKTQAACRNFLCREAAQYLISKSN